MFRLWLCRETGGSVTLATFEAARQALGVDYGRELGMEIDEDADVGESVDCSLTGNWMQMEQLLSRLKNAGVERVTVDVQNQGEVALLTAKFPRVQAAVCLEADLEVPIPWAIKSGNSPGSRSGSATK